MRAMRRATFPPTVAIALLGVALAASPILLSVAAEPLAVTKSGDNLIFSFPTTSPYLYTVLSCPDLLQWTDIPPGIPGDGTMKTFTLSNAVSGNQGFYRLLIQRPGGLLLSQSAAFAVLHYDCGGIKEKVYVTGFDLISGGPSGEVYLSTVCSCGKACSSPHSAWAVAIWDLAGNTVFSAALSNAPAYNTNFIASDGLGDTIYNARGAAYLVVPIPAAPTDVSAAQSGDQFDVSWMPNGVNPAAITSSILTATPVDSTNPVLTATVSGTGTNGVIPTLQPQTTYQITVVNTTISGFSPASAPVSLTTSPATIPPSAPTNVVASWLNPDPSGPDTLNVNWQAAVPGNSPVDQYLVTITGSDGAGTFTQTVSGTTLTTYFTEDPTPNWTVTVQAHNAAGWGPVSSPFFLGGL